MKSKKYLVILVLFFLVFSRLSAVTYSITEEQLTELENNLTELEKSNEIKQKELTELQTELNELQKVNEQTQKQLEEVKKSWKKSENKSRLNNWFYGVLGFIVGMLGSMIYSLTHIF